MEKYKKKTLNFMGFSRDLRKVERDNQRNVSRLNRFSISRPLYDESITEEKKENDSRIPTMGKPKAQAGSRVELLQKWKQEKMVKKQQESKLKKPAFKVGVTKPISSPSLGNKPLFALDTSSRLFKSSFQVSNSRLFGKKEESLATSNIKPTMKVSNSQSSKKPDVATDILKTSAKDMKIQPTKSKIGVASKPEFKWTKNKDQLSGSRKQPTITLKPLETTKPLETKKDQLSGSRKGPAITSKPLETTKPLETKKESRLQPLNTRSKVISTARGVKSNIPSSGLPKPTASRTLNKVPDQTHIQKSNTPKIPEGISNNKHIPGKNNVKSILTFSKSKASQQKGISEKTSPSESELPNKPGDAKSKVPNKPADAKSKVPNKPGGDFATFECELSHIEPVKEERKSFAPKGFMFQPPAELSSSLFLEDGPSAIFLRMRNQFLRTSTPKKSPSDQKSSPKINDIECSENEDVECLKDENTQCSKNKNTEYEPGNLETLLSSSLGSVTLNDPKPVNCKQSLTFESPEAVSTQNQEDMLLSSEIIHPEHSLTTEPPFTGAINPPILPDSVEIDKIEINSTDISPTVAINPPTLPDSVKSEKTEMDSTDISPTVAINPHILPDSVKSEKTEMNSTDISPTGAINSPILPDSVRSGKTEMNSIDTSPADDSKITVLSPEVDSVFSEGKEMLDAKKNQFMSIGFLQKRENGSVKISMKARNFRQSEKPGLMSINESLENTPKSAIKKKVVESDFTPRRSLRLAKLSGHFSSLDNLLDNPKPKDQAGPKGNVTPRRSIRLSKFSSEFNSAENLFDIRRPTLYGTPEKDRPVLKLHSKVTYDFDRLTSEMEEETCPRTASFGKVSLLPITRPSIMRHSIRGDLMSFSPDV